MLLLGKELEEFGLSIEQKQLLGEIDLEFWLKKQANPVAQNLTGRTSAPWTHGDIDDLVKDVVANFAHSSVPVLPPPDAKHAADEDWGADSGPICPERIAQILSKIIATKNKTEHSYLPRMRIVSTARYAKNPFRRDVVTALARVHVWRSRLSKEIKKVRRMESPSRILVLLSAALYGGIFDSDLLIAIAKALEEVPRTLGFANQRLYVQISAAWRGTRDFSQRTWYPDPLTAILIARFVPGDLRDCKLTAPRRKIVESFQRDMIATFRAAGISASDEPESLDTFVKDLRVAYQVRMPSLLAAYAAHGIRSEGLPARALNRIYSVRPAESNPVVMEAPQQSKDESGFIDNPQEVEPDLETELRKVLKQETPQEALKVLHTIRRDESLPPTVRSSLILEFAADLLTRSGGTTPMQMGTLRAWVPKLVEYIGVSLQDSDYDILPRSRLSSDDLESIYRAALEEIDPEDDTPSVRKCLVESLRVFHEFLVRKHRVKPLLDTSMFLLHRFGSTVDANLITFEEYHQTLDWLDRNWPSNLDPALHPMARMMVILGFRCGLRRNEALAINWFSVCSGGPKPELLIQPYLGHPLKSGSAKRRLPLSLLMNGDELKEILALALKRQNASSGSIKADQMFAGVTARRLFPIIHKAMRAVTKDPSIKYHHLRHSFATWTFVRFMIGESGRIPEQLQHLCKTRDWLAGSVDFCKQTHDVVCKVATVDGQPAVKLLPSTTRLNAYLLAQMMGHSSPSMTFRHYIHGVDWLLDSCLRADPECQPKRSILAVAGGMAERSAYSPKLDTATIPARLLTKKWPELAIVVPAVIDQSPLWPWRSWDLLYRHFRRRDDKTGDEVNYGFSEDEAVGCFQRATYLRNMRPRHLGERGGKGWQHRMICASPRSRIPCPRAPRKETDIAVVDKFAPALSRLLTPQSDLIPVLRYYADNIWQRRNQLFFHNPNRPEAAIAYLKLLEEMGINRKQHRFSVFHKMKSCPAVDQWKAALDLPDEVVIHRPDPPDPDSHAYDSWIGIEPSLSNCKPKRGNYRTGNVGFRFLLLMAQIVYGATDIEQLCVDLIDALRQSRIFTLKDSIANDSWLNFAGPNPKKATLLHHLPVDPPRKRPHKKTKPWIRVDELVPVIEDLMLADGPLDGKPHTECKRLLVTYFQAVSEMFPKAWADHKRRSYSLLKISGLRMMLALLPDVIKRCDLYENSTYSLETFKRQLEPLAGLALLGSWERSTVAAGISSKGKRKKLLGQLRAAMSVTLPSTVTT